MRMSRSHALAAVAAALVLAAPLSAQLNAVGVRLGLARSTQVGGFYDVVEDVGGTVESRTGFVAGAFLEYGLPSVHERLSLEAGLDLTRKGARVPPDGGLKERVLDITYLEAPLLARGSLATGLYRLFAHAGPVLALKVGTSGEVDGAEIDVDEEVKGTDVGFALGIGGQRGPIGLALRYVLGLSNISESPDPDEAAKNRQWALMGSYTIPLGR